VQDTLRASLPRNNFHLDATAKRHLLVAGGIGITPIKAMMHVLAASGADFMLHYCARSAAHAAFMDELSKLGGAWRVRAHFDDAGQDARLDASALPRDYAEGTHLYHCGPPGLMAACAGAASHWPEGTVHSELFQVPEPLRNSTAAESSAGSFAVEIASTGARVPVPEGCSIADALNETGIAVPTSCVSGLCGTCKLRYLCGEVDHQDYILSEAERAEYLTSCVSRARTPVLVLDF